MGVITMRTINMVTTSTLAIQPAVLDFPAAAGRGGGLNFKTFTTPNYLQKDKVIFVVGPTGAGKSRLSIDLATRFSAEVINSDKIQAYKGLDVLTNKVTEEEKCGVPHHLLSVLNPNDDFTAQDFCVMASTTADNIVSRGKTPIIVGGSNSYIEALINCQVNNFRTRYEFCFLWVDVSMPILYSFVSDRVDRMVERGMVEEARKMFKANGDYSKGIRRAIGVPEFDMYFREEAYLDEATRELMLRNAINDVKDNTCKLASRQLEKIRNLKKMQGKSSLTFHRIEATEVFRQRRRSEIDADEAWERLVMGPSSRIVSEFLYGFRSKYVGGRVGSIREVVAEAALAAVVASA